MIIQWHGNASVRISFKTSHLLFDPYIKIEGSDFQNCLEDLKGSNAVFVTHGHFDHVLAIPELLTHEDLPIYCTKAPAATLTDCVEKKENIKVIKDGDVIHSADMNVTAFQSKHIRFTVFTVLAVLLNPRMRLFKKNIAKILELSRKFQEAAETVCYLIQAENKRILLFGSLGLAKGKNYPKNVDLMIIPIQGRLRIWPLAVSIIKRIKPKTVLFDHFDDAFPPASLIIDIHKIAGTIHRHHPDIHLIIPKYNQKILF